MDKNNIILYSVLIIGIITFLFIIGNKNNFFENSSIIYKKELDKKSYKNKKELDTNYSKPNPNLSIINQNYPIVPNPNLSIINENYPIVPNPNLSIINENYPIVPNPNLSIINENYPIDPNPVKQIEQSNKPENKIKKFNINKYINTPDTNNSYSELLSMSNSMINFEKPLNYKTRDTNENIPNPRYEDFSSIEDTLIFSDFESKYVNQLDFPENISEMLPRFNADNVAQLYNKDNITDLYNTINTDIYKRYKTYNLV